MLRFQKRKTENQPVPLGNNLLPWQQELLTMRGINSPEKARAFLEPDLKNLHDPFSMADMDKAVKRINKAIDQKESIVIYGDYDVDGICATSILLEAFEELGAMVDFYLPSRHGEGYGLNTAAVEELARHHSLMVTVDCGITAHQEVALAMSLGMDVIVTDHHQLPGEPVEALGILNPLIAPYPFGGLCGAGVAGKLVQALGGEGLLATKLDLVALATIADIVPLKEENRILTYYGLQMLSQSKRPGITALKKAAGIETAQIKASQVAFGLAPRLNAAGRLSDARVGVTLLTTKDEKIAEKTALFLQEENARRQQIEKETLRQALAIVEKEVNLAKRRSLVVAGEGWNSGVVGLVASRLVEKYYYPTVVLSRQGSDYVGSCRSIPGVNIYQALKSCEGYFSRFGGHEQAAGLTMPQENLAAFIKDFDQFIWKTADPQAFIPLKEYDLPLALEEVTSNTIEALEKMQPTGFGNPEPVFLLDGVGLMEARRIGKDGDHLKVLFSDGQWVKEGIGFRLGGEEPFLAGKVQALFVPEMNHFQGISKAQCMVKAIRGTNDQIPEKFLQYSLVEKQILEDFRWLLSNNKPIAPNLAAQKMDDWRRDLLSLLTGGQGTLLMARTAQMAQEAFEVVKDRVDIAFTQVQNPKGYHSLLIAPDITRLKDWWQYIVLMDGELTPWEAEAIKALCPGAKVLVVSKSKALKGLINTLALEDEPLRNLYKTLRGQNATTLKELAQATGLTQGQVLVGLESFSQMNLITWQENPFSYAMLPPVPCNIGEAPLLKALRGQ